MSTAEVDGHRVAIIDDYPGDCVRVHFVQGGQYGPRRYLVGWDELGYPTWETVSEAHAGERREGLQVPREFILAIAEAVKPGPSQGEIKQLEDALAVERARTEKVIAAFLKPRIRPVPVVFDGDWSEEHIAAFKEYVEASDTNRP